MALMAFVQTLWAAAVPMVQDSARLLVGWRAGGSAQPLLTVYNSALWTAATMPLDDSPVTPDQIVLQSFSSSRGTTTLLLGSESHLINTLPLAALAQGPSGTVSGTKQSSTTIWLDQSAFSGKAVSAHRLDNLLILSPQLGSGLTVYDMGSGLPARLTTLADTAALWLEGISALTSLQTTAGPVLLALSQTTGHVSALRIGADGTLTPLSSIGPELGFPAHLPSQIGAVTLNGQNFVLVGSFGSQSLSVLRLEPDGKMTLVDHRLDTLATRFGGLAAMDILALNGQVLVAVAGNDGGVTLFQLLPSGLLVLRDVLEDGLDTALQGIVDLRFVVVENRVELFALATGDRGVTRLLLDPDRFGPGVVGLVSTATEGTSAADILTAPRGGSWVRGGAGDDILIAGVGSDTLEGGAGADLLLLLPDPERRDVIRGFSPAEDILDLSGFSGLYSMSGVAVSSTPTGALLRIGTTEILIEADRSLTAAQVKSIVRFAADRVPLPDPPPTSVVSDPTSQDDSFFWRSGARLYDGGAGTDRVDYSAAPEAVVIDLGTPALNAGAALGHRFQSIEILIGTRFNDRLVGDAAGNTLQGGAGNDRLDGAAGDDWLMPGPGNDSLEGGSGLDTASFSDATAAVTASLQTGLARTGSETDVLSGIEHLTGSVFDDVLTGDGGSNRLRGLSGNDWLTPGAGADLVDGGAGVDMVSFVDATSRAVIDLGRGTAVIAGETDRLSGVENLTATIFADMITGDAGANRIRALGDYDWMVGSGGRDIYEGGTGRDTVAYSNAAAGVTASLSSGTGTAGQASGDRYTEVENLTGGSFGDRLTGNTDRNILRGLGGDDFLFGLAGNDTLDGGAGRDHLNGGLGTDRITGGRGNDTIDGGGGWDTAIFTGRRAQYSVTENADGSTSVLHKSGGTDGIDLLVNIDVLEFSDGRLFL